MNPCNVSSFSSERSKCIVSRVVAQGDKPPAITSGLSQFNTSASSYKKLACLTSRITSERSTACGLRTRERRQAFVTGLCPSLEADTICDIVVLGNRSNRLLAKHTSSRTKRDRKSTRLNSSH